MPYLLNFELLSIVLGLCFWLYQFRYLLFYASHSFVHDSYNFALPVFYHLVATASTGSIAYWNPYSHGGEPFFPIAFFGYLLDPIAWIVIKLGLFYTKNPVLLFNWLFFFRTLIALSGVYFTLRLWTKDNWDRALLLLLVFFSSMVYAPFRQIALLANFLWVPWIAYSLVRMAEHEKRGWSEWLILGWLLGMGSSGYVLVGPALFTLLFVGGLMCVRPFRTKIFKTHQFWLKFGTTIGIALLMALPNLAIIKSYNDLIYPARMISTAPEETRSAATQLVELGTDAASPSISNYKQIQKTSTFLSPWALLQLFFPDGNSKVHGSTHAWGKPGETVIYIGILGILLAFFGMIHSVGSWDKVWLGALTLAILILLGTQGIVHRILFPIFPPLWIGRHTSFLAQIVPFCLGFFVLKGWRVFRLKLENWNEFPSISRFLLRRSFPMWLAITALFLAISPLQLEADSFGGIWSAICVSIVGLCLYFVFCKNRQLTLYFSVLTAATLMILSFTPFKIYWVFYFSAFGIFPGLFLLQLVRQVKRGNLNPNIARTAILGVVICLLALDLFYAFHRSRYLFSGMPTPCSYLKMNCEVSTPPFPARWQAFPDHPRVRFPTDPKPEQIPRFLSLYYQKPTVLSELYESERNGAYVNYEQKDLAPLLKQPRWSTPYLMKSYHRLIHSDLSPRLLNDIFLLGRDSVQFRTRAFAIPAESFLPAAHKMAKNNLNFFSSNLLLEGQLSPLEKCAKRSKQPFSYKNITYRNSEAVFTATAQCPGYFLWNDAYDSNWSVTIDSKPAVLLRANGLFKAVRMDSGTHLIRFTYDPKWFRYSLWASYWVSALSLGLAVVLRGSAIHRKELVWKLASVH